MATTTYSLKLDRNDLEAGLQSIQQSQEKLFARFQKNVSDTRSEEASLNDTLRRQTKTLEPLRQEVARLNEVSRTKIGLSKEQQEQLKQTTAQISSLEKEYRVLNKTQLENIAISKRKSASQKTFLKEMNEVESFAKKEIASKNKQSEAVRKLTEARERANSARNSGGNELVRHIRRIESLAVAYYAVTRGIDHLVGKGISLNKTIEDGKVGIGALITAGTTLDNATAGERFQASMVLSARAIEKIRQEAKLTSATFPELTTVFQQAIGRSLGAGQAMGTTLSDVIDNTITLAKRMTNIAGSIGMEIYKVNEEVRSILQGTVTKDTEIAKMLGITNKDIDEAKKTANGLFNYLEGKLAVFEVLESEQTYSKITARMVDSIETLRLATAEPIFEDLKIGMAEFTKYVSDNTVEITESFHEVYKSIKSGGEFIYEHREIIVQVVKIYALWKAGMIAVSVATSVNNKRLALATILAEKQAIATANATKATKLHTLALMATPWAIATTGLMALAYAFSDTEKSSIDATSSIEEFTSAIDKMTVAQAKAEKWGIGDKIVEQNEKIKDASLEFAKAQKDLRTAKFTKKSDLSEEQRAFDLALKTYEQEKNGLEILKEKEKIANKIIGDKKTGTKSTQTDIYKYLPQEELKKSIALIEEARAREVAIIEETKKQKLGIHGQYLIDASVMTVSALTKELSIARSYDIKLGNSKVEEDKKALDAMSKFWEKFYLKQGSEVERLKKKYSEDYKDYADTDERKQALTIRLMEDIAKIRKKSVDDVNKEYKTLIEEAEGNAERTIEIESWKAEELKKIKHKADTEKTPLKDLSADQKRAIELSNILETQLANSLTNAIQDTIDSEFNFGKFAGSMAGAVGSAITSTAITNAITNKGMDYTSLGIGVGLSVLSSVMGGDGRDSEAEARAIQQEQFRKATEALQNSSRALENTVSILEGSGKTGTAISTKITSLSTEKNLFTNLFEAFDNFNYSDIWGSVQKNKIAFDALGISMASTPAEMQLYRDRLKEVTAEIRSSALSFANELLPRFESIGKISGSLKGTTDYQDALLERAKQQLPVYARERDGFIEYADSISKTGIEINNLLNLIEANTVGTATYEDSLASLIDILDLSDDATLEYALNTVESIQLVGESFAELGGTAEEIAKNITESTSGIKTTFTSIQSIIDNIAGTTETVSTTLFGSDYLATLDRAKIAQQNYLADIYDTDLASAFQKEVSSLSGMVGDFTSASQFSSLADYEFNKALVASQFEEFKKNALLAGEQVDENITLLQNIENAINGTDGTNDLQAQILDAIKSQASTEDILAIVNSQGGTQLSVDSSGTIVKSFALGGYTGDGGKFEKAGDVHKGEYVFNQEDLSRVGGVDSVERFIAGERGYIATEAGGMGGVVSELRLLRGETQAMNSRLSTLESIGMKQIKTQIQNLRESKTSNILLATEKVVS